MIRPALGTWIQILIDEGGAPVGEMVRVTGWSDDASEGRGVFYSWDNVDGWITSDNTSEEKFYSQVDSDHEILQNAAEQFVVAFEADELNKEMLEYFHDVFKDALKG